MAFCISYFKSVHEAFTEANRILKPGGALVVGFLDKDSIIGKEYEARRQYSVFYKQAMFYTAGRIVNELKTANFRSFNFSQGHFQFHRGYQGMPRQGFGEGSFVVVKALKKSNRADAIGCLTFKYRLAKPSQMKK